MNKNKMKLIFAIGILKKIGLLIWIFWF